MPLTCLHILLNLEYPEFTFRHRFMDLGGRSFELSDMCKGLVCYLGCLIKQEKGQEGGGSSGVQNHSGTTGSCADYE
jgi:hypothetical protein